MNPDDWFGTGASGSNGIKGIQREFVKYRSQRCDVVAAVEAGNVGRSG